MASSEFITLSPEEAGRVSFPHVFDPNVNEKGEKKYEVTLLFSKDSPALKRLVALAKAVKVEAYGANPPANLESPFKDGNIKFNADPDKYYMYENKVAVCFTSQFQPAVVDESVQKIIQPRVFYPGCWAVVHCNAFSWNYKNMKKGISFGFDAVQKVRDDDSFGGGGVNPQDVFGVVAGNNPENYGGDTAAGDDWLGMGPTPAPQAVPMDEVPF